MNTPKKDTRSVAELLAAHIGEIVEVGSDVASIAVVAVFDHDYCCHALVQEWDRTLSPSRWEYRLWFCDTSVVMPVQNFPDAQWPTPPLVEAAITASDWRLAMAEQSRAAHKQFLQ